MPAASYNGACNNSGTVSGSVTSNNATCSGGGLIITYSGTDQCGNSISTTCNAVVTSAAPATVSCPSLPSVNCEQAANYAVPAASYTGACNNNGSLSGSVTATNFNCSGGSLTVTYSGTCLLYTSPSPRDATLSRMPSSA